jgi:anti-anti-sigma factor
MVNEVMEFNALHSSPSSSSQDGDIIQVAVSGETGYVKVHGRGSFKVSTSLKNFAARLQDGGGNQLIVDLEDCIGMDSTFMGVLAGISQRLKKESGGRVSVCGVSEKIKNLMTTLGLSRLVHILDSEDKGSVPGYTELSREGETTLQSAETMLEAHENLVGIHKDNSLRFQDVLEYLREDIQRQQG